MPRRPRPPAVRVIPYGDASPRTAGALALQEPRTPPVRPAMVVAAGGREPPPDRDVRAAADATVRLMAEVLAGTRPLRQLARRATAEVCLGLAPYVRPMSPGVRTSPPRVLTTWVQQPAPGYAEAGAVIRLAGRAQALALRLQIHRDRWRCTVVETTAPP